MADCLAKGVMLLLIKKNLLLHLERDQRLRQKVKAVFAESIRRNYRGDHNYAPLR
jgi:hypothetical protein